MPAKAPGILSQQISAFEIGMLLAEIEDPHARTSTNETFSKTMHWILIILERESTNQYHTLDLVASHNAWCNLKTECLEVAFYKRYAPGTCAMEGHILLVGQSGIT